MSTRTRHTVAVQHPAMSHALLIDSDTARTDDALRAWACLYVARNFDEVLPAAEFVVVPVDPTADWSLSLFPADDV